MRSPDVLPTIRSAPAARTNSPEEIRALRAMPYSHYLHSDWWRWRRNQKLRAAGYRCERCGDNRQPQTHHRTYDRLGAEEDADLEVLCGDCHLGEHFNQTRTYIDLYAKLLSGILAHGKRLAFADLLEEGKLLCAEYQLPYRPTEFHAAVSRLLPRIPFTPPPRMAALFETSTDGPLTRGEAAATMAWLKQGGFLKPMPVVSARAVRDAMTYVELVTDPSGRAEAAAHEEAVSRFVPRQPMPATRRVPARCCPFCGDYVLQGARTCGESVCIAQSEKQDAATEGPCR